MNVLIDSSIWIDYFRSGDKSNDLEYLIDNNFIFTNDLILTELIPYLRLEHHAALVELIKQVAKFPLLIDWKQIQEFQYSCIKAGINEIAITDLIIIQNAIQNNSFIYSLKHFQLMQDILNFKLYRNNKYIKPKNHT